MSEDAGRVSGVLAVVREKRGRLSEGEAAASICLSMDRFRAVFLKEVGVGFRTYCGNVKMEYCVELLGEKENSIEDIAVALGYSSRSAFEHWFARNSGQWPAQYRKTTTLSIDGPASHSVNSARHPVSSGDYL